MRPIRKIFDALENHTEGETLEFSSFYIVSTHSQSVASPAMGHVPPPSTSKSESQLSKYCVVCEIS